MSSAKQLGRALVATFGRPKQRRPPSLGIGSEVLSFGHGAKQKHERGLEMMQTLFHEDLRLVDELNQTLGDQFANSDHLKSGHDLPDGPVLSGDPTALLSKCQTPLSS